MQNNEDATFKALRRLPFDQVEKIIPVDLITIKRRWFQSNMKTWVVMERFHNLPVLEQAGWTEDEFVKALENKYKGLPYARITNDSTHQ